MASNMISDFVKTRSFRCIDELSGIEVWTKLKVSKVEIRSDAVTADSPVSIKQYTDRTLYIKANNIDSRNAKVITPPAIRVFALTDNLSVMEAVLAAFANTTQLFEVTTKNILSMHMAVIGLSVDQSPDATNVYKMVIDMEQTEIPGSGKFDPENDSDESNFGIRIQKIKGADLIGKIKGAASELTSSVGELYNKVSTSILG